MTDRYELESQEEDQWCWAAVALSVERYYSPASPLTQCDIASRVFGTTCCSDRDLCNRPARLHDALREIGKSKGAPSPGPMEFSDIQKRLDEHRPVCLRIGWDEGGGHFVVVCGYGLSRSGIPLVDVEDPLFGSATVIYEDFKNSYLASGKWTTTYPV